MTEDWRSGARDMLVVLLTVTTGGANDGSKATARRGAANRPKTTIAAVSIVTATLRVTAMRAMDMCFVYFL